MINTRFDSPAISNASIMIPDFAFEYILELPVSCSGSLIELISSVVHGSLSILATAYAICDLPVPAGPTAIFHMPEVYAYGLSVLSFL